jgi:parallel beta-helix repeat protein
VLGGNATNITVSNNMINNAGQSPLGVEGGAIEIVGVGKNTITHNEVDNSAYNGIWDESKGGNTISYNKVQNFNLKADDGGGIYMFQPNSGDTIAYNYVTASTTAIPGGAYPQSYAIYSDDHVSNATIIGNYAQAYSAGIYLHGNSYATVQDNVAIGGSRAFDTQASSDGAEVTNSVIKHNLFNAPGMVAWDEDGGGITQLGNTLDNNVYIGTSNSSWGWDTGTYAQHLSSDAPTDAHSLLAGSMSTEYNAATMQFVAGSKALQLGMAQPTFNQAGIVSSVVQPPVVSTDQIVLHLSQDAFGSANAKFVAKVDGVDLNAPTEVSAVHGKSSQTFNLSGHWGVGDHVLDIRFTNDSYAGAGMDRNLWAQANGITVDGTNYGPAADTRLACTNSHMSITFHDVTA